MSSQQKNPGATVAALVLAYGWYAVTVATHGGAGSPEVTYRLPMLTMVVAVIVRTAASHAYIAVSAPRQATRPNERDRQISRHARSVGSVVLPVTTRPCGAGCADTPRFHPHRTPTSSPWPNQVERWFRDLADKNLRREIFGSVPDLIARPGVAASLVGCHSQRGGRKSGTDQGSTHVVVRGVGRPHPEL